MGNKPTQTFLGPKQVAGGTTPTQMSPSNRTTRNGWTDAADLRLAAVRKEELRWHKSVLMLGLWISLDRAERTDSVILELEYGYVKNRQNMCIKLQNMGIFVPGRVWPWI